MSDKILAVIDPEGDVKEQLQSIRDNFLSLQKDSLRGAAQVLAYTNLSNNIAITGLEPIGRGLRTSINCSGGLVMVFASTSISSSGGTTTAKIIVDDEAKQQASVSNDPAGSEESLSLMWAGEIGQGVHTIDLLIGTNASPTIIGGSVPVTSIMAVEFLI